MAASSKRWSPGRRKRQAWLTAGLFLLPAIALYLVFAFIPTLEVFEYSLNRWDGISPDREWVGLGNYDRLFGDRIFWEAFFNTVEWTAIIVVINVGLGVVLAAILARKIKGRIFFQTCMFIPVIQAPITTAIIWRWMYQPNGAINEGLSAIGLGFLATPWLGDLTTALPALAIAHSWSTLGLSIVIFLAGLQAVDDELYDAAKIDGATPVQAFWYITLPALRPVTAVVFVLTATAAFKAFDLIWGTTQGGPIRATEILATYMYKRGVLENNYGYGSAVAVALLVIVTLAMAVYLYMQARRDD